MAYSSAGGRDLPAFSPAFSWRGPLHQTRLNPHFSSSSDLALGAPKVLQHYFYVLLFLVLSQAILEKNPRRW
jgi:hypothetical protein